MPVTKIFTGQTSTDGGLAANYDDNVAPATGDRIILNDQSTKDWVQGTLAGALTLDVIVDRGFTKTIGTSGAPMMPATLNTLIFAGNTISPCYFKGSTAINRVIVNSASQKDDLVNLQGSIGQIDVLAGKCLLASSPTVTGRIKVVGSSGGVIAQLTIPSSTTLTGCELYIEGGRLDVSSDVETIQVSGGEFILNGGADISVRLEMTGGITYWDASDTAAPSTITLAEVMGGTLRTRMDRRGRTLTNCNVYADGDVDFSIGGCTMTISNPIRCFGSNRPKFPIGTTHTIGI